MSTHLPKLPLAGRDSRPVAILALAAVALLATAAAAAPADSRSAPPPARAPFDAVQAKRHQAAWAGHLRTSVTTQNSLGIRLVLIPPGEFLMGGDPAMLEETLPWADRVRQNPPGAERRRVSVEEMPQHRVRLSRPYLMGMTEITIGQYRKFVDATGYVTETERFGGGNSGSKAETNPAKTKVNWRAPGYAVTDESPVTEITWNDVIPFCNWLSEQDRLPPAYRRDGTGEWILEPAAKGYRLPTEAEWEFACRAGTTTQFSFGNDLTELGKYAWYDQNANRFGAGAVGSKLPNPFGLYDMHGNAWERCQDWFDEKWYAQSPAVDPAGPASGSRKIARGGAWHYFDLHCRSSYRNNYQMTFRSSSAGFRVVRTW